MKRRGDRPAKVQHDTHPVRVVAKAKPPPFDSAKPVTTFNCFYDGLAVISGVLGKAFIFFMLIGFWRNLDFAFGLKYPMHARSRVLSSAVNFLKRAIQL